MAYYNDSVFGYTDSGTLGATMMNPGAASSDTDWGAILANGIRGAAQGAIGAMTAGAYQSGQLAQATATKQQNNQLLWLLILGGVVYFAAKG